jgi:hypothetical protein
MIAARILGLHRHPGVPAVRHRAERASLPFVCISLLGALVMAPSASGQNLLTNAGLEGLDGFVIPPGSCAQPGNWYWAYQCIPEIEPPTWWFPFWNDGPTPVDPTTNYRRPEFRVYAWPDGPHYAFEGQKYLVFFGFFGAIDAGIYQQVSVTPGRTYSFSCQVFAWSNCLWGKEGASGAGCNDFPPDQAVFKAGIDPTGGTDYTSTSIVWSDGLSIYDAYAPISVSAAAANSTLTVYVRCTFWHNYIQHNDAHVDALSLIDTTPPGPALQVEPQQFTPSMWPGDPAPPDDAFTVRNSGDGTAMSFAVSEDADWLSIDPPTGSATDVPVPVTMVYSPAGLPVGEHEATVTVTAAGASNSPQQVSVTLTVRTVPPDLDGDLDVDSEDFGVFQRCYSGQGQPLVSVCASSDFDLDNDVDGDDFSVFQGCLSGPNVPASRTCAGF